ncbi:MAG TPA: flagellar hook protein FlgE [Bryobacteraceae bacterium]|nr:flagellar hook protein FlgE [Bryobacteraceae bacterium]HUJ22452.1 flagellar hook protein FlgE [Bryobacteraceae bacterium]
MPFTSFSSALSALNANTTAIDVVGNNLANLSTTGFKASTVSFQDLVTQSLGAGLGETQVGFGTGLPLTTRQFTQGALQSTSGVDDAAIQGDGFFVLSDSTGAQLFTRAGNFQVDAQGHLLSASGDAVQGWTQINGQVNTNGPIGNITVPVGTLQPPVATTQFSLDMNLNAAAVVGSADATFSYPVQVVDSLGTSHVLTVSFDKTAGGTWDYSVSIPGEDLTSGTPGTPTVLTTGTLNFDSSGLLTTPDAASGPVAISATGLTDGAADLNINWNLYDSNQAPRLTQFAQISAVAANDPDGRPAAQLVRVGLSNGGQILAQYSNGQQVMVGQLALASIRNPESLIAVGNNNYQTSSLTASPAIGVPDTGGRGKVLGGQLEASTVDIATEFTDMIVYQRGYEANAKVVNTADQLSQDTINLIR